MEVNMPAVDKRKEKDGIKLAKYSIANPIIKIL